MPRHNINSNNIAPYSYGREQQQQQQQQQAIATNNAISTATTPTRTTYPNNNQSNKDPIVRLLAEVFQVASQAGQVKWQQVSDSLVPVTVYSRTSNVWLQHWLQRIYHGTHHNQPMTLLSSSSSLSEYMKFQIVAHQPTTTTTTSANRYNHQQITTSYFKLLDLTIVQPGTKLGQASEYFVYWKDKRLDKTWGLNFGSTQEARQFYDICTLNLDNLNPNPKSQFFNNLLYYQQQQQQQQQLHNNLPFITNNNNNNNNNNNHNNNNKDRKFSASHHGTKGDGLIHGFTNNRNKQQAHRDSQHLKHSLSYHTLFHNDQQPPEEENIHNCNIIKYNNQPIIEPSNNNNGNQQRSTKYLAKLRTRSSSRHKSGQQARFEQDLLQQAKTATNEHGIGSKSMPASPARHLVTSNDSNNSSYKHHPQCSMLLQSSSGSANHNSSSNQQYQLSTTMPDQQQLEMIQNNGGILRTKGFVNNNSTTATANSKQQQKRANSNTSVNAPPKSIVALNSNNSQISASVTKHKSSSSSNKEQGKAPPIPAHQSSITSSQSLHSKREGRVRYMGNLNRQHQPIVRSITSASINQPSSIHVVQPKHTNQAIKHQMHNSNALDNHQQQQQLLYNKQISNNNNINCPIHQKQQIKLHQHHIQKKNHQIQPQKQPQQQVYFHGGQLVDTNAKSSPSANSLVMQYNAQKQHIHDVAPIQEPMIQSQASVVDSGPLQQQYQCSRWFDNNMTSSGNIGVGLVDESEPPPIQPRTTSDQQSKQANAGGMQLLSASNISERRNIVSPQQQPVQRTRSHQQSMPPIDSSFSISSNSSQTHARNARLARAQYANSRNQNEFRSLDVGGVQPSQAQLDLINENLRRHHRINKQQNQQIIDASTAERLQPQDLNRDTSLDLNDKQQSIIKSRSTDDMRNVATTTDDLPMDPQTLKRMLILSSQSGADDTSPQQDNQPNESMVINGNRHQTHQVIDKRTMSKRKRAATLTGSSTNQSFDYRDSPTTLVGASPSNGNNSGRQSQNRALSLGVDLSDINRSRAVRSDTGRRRSLERTSCVDFDSPAPLFNVASGTGMSSDQRGPLAAPNLGRASQHLVEPVAFVDSPKSITTIIKNETEVDDAHNYDEVGDENDKELLYDYEEQIRKALERDMLESTQHQSGSLRRRAQPKRAHHIAQESFHSCPNSLLKKKQLIDTQEDYLDQMIYLSDMELNQSSSRRQNDDYHGNYNDVYHNEHYGSNKEIQFACDNEDYDEDLGIGILNASSFDINTPFRRSQYMTNNSESVIKMKPHHTLLSQDQYGEEDGMGDQQITTRASSRCSSTNCKYGLYDSDDEEDDNDCDDCDDYDNQYNKFPAKGGDVTQSYRSPARGHQLPTCLGGSLGTRGRRKVRAVDGYDQTMMRNSDKSINNKRRGDVVRERRARSQPPPIEVLENVQKLIQEVQAELDSIRRDDDYPGLSEYSPSAYQQACLRALDINHHQDFNPTANKEQSKKRLNYSDPEEANSSDKKSNNAAMGKMRNHNVAHDHDFQQKTIFRRVQQPLSSSDNEQATTIPQFNNMRCAHKGSTGEDDKITIEERLSMGTSSNIQGDYTDTSEYRRQQQYGGFRDSTLDDRGDNGDSRQRSATKKATKFKCTGAVRKAGFLFVKKWILKRRQSIELARKRGWKRYWVCLRGTTLLFHSLVDYELDEQPQRQRLMQTSQDTRYNNIGKCYMETEPRHLIILDGSIAQPVPEHPKRDYVFCLSTTFGDAYLFQSSCQLETDNWIGAIHNACAASLARDQGRALTTRLLSSQIDKISEHAQHQAKMRLLAEKQMLSISQSFENDINNFSKSSSNIANQRYYESSGIRRYVEYRAVFCQQLQEMAVYQEQLHCQSYQLRCYLAACKSLTSNQSNNGDTTTTTTHASTSLNGVELPHTKTLLMHVSKPTKLLLNKLGVFTVSSFHAYVCARAGGPDALMNNLHALLTKSALDGCAYADEMHKARIDQVIDRLSKEKSLTNTSDEVKNLQIRLSKVLLLEDNGEEDNQQHGTTSNTLDEDFITVNVQIDSGNYDLINSYKVVCLTFSNLSLDDQRKYHQLNPYDYFIRLVVVHDGQQQDDYIPNRKEHFNNWPTVYDHIRIEKKISYKICLTRDTLNQRFGFSVEAQLIEQNSYDELCVFCSRIEPNSPAQMQGLKIDDEIMTINGAQVSDLDMMFIENTLHEELSLVMLIKSCRLKQPDTTIQDNIHGPDDNLKLNYEVMGHLSLDDYKNLDITRRSEDNNTDGDQKLNLINDNSEHQDNYNLITDEYIASLVCPPPPPRPKSSILSHSDLIPTRDSKNILPSKSSPANVATKPFYHDCSKLEANTDCKFTDDLSGKLIQPSPTGITREDFFEQNCQLRETKLENERNIDDKMMNMTQYHRKSSNLIDDRSWSNPPHSVRDPKGKSEPEQHQVSTKSANGINITSNSTAISSNRDLNKLETFKKPLIPVKPTHVKEAMRSLKDGQSITKVHSIDTDQKISTSTATNSQGTTNVERLRKSILEILETERTYVDHLNSVLSLYMEPLKSAEYLQVDDIKQLFNTITDIASFQRTFQENLEQEVINRTWNTNTKTGSGINLGISLSDLGNYLLQYNSVEDFSDILLGVADAFLSYADKFKLYSTFCASYSKLQKLLHPTSVHQSNSSSLLNDTFASNGNSTFFSHQSNSSSSMSASSQTFIYAHKLNEFFVNLSSASSIKQQQKNKQNNSNNNASSSSSSNSSNTQSTIKKHQHQQNFESYLIKPIQRIVKYPLLISSLIHLANGDSFEHKQLSAAMKQMEQVAGHINDMQRIHEEYGFIFDHLQRQYGQQQLQQITTTTTNETAANQQQANASVSPNVASTSSSGNHQSIIDLNVGELLYYGGVDWLNMHEFSGKVKKSQELYPIIFVFSSAVVFLCKERIRQKKKLSMPLTTTKLTDVVEVIRYQALIPVSEVQVRSLPSSSGSSQQNLVKELKTPSPNIVESASSTSLTTSFTTGNLAAAAAVSGDINKQPNEGRISSLPTSFQWELFKCCPANVNAGLIVNAGLRRADGKVYLFSNSTNELRNAFLRKIRYIIRESVRNMNVPLARSPSSKSTSSKKMTSSSSSSSSVSSPLAPVDQKNDANNQVEPDNKRKGKK